MKRILQVVSCLERGGTESFIMNHYRHIDRLKYQFDFLVFLGNKSPYEEEINSLGGKVIYADTLPDILHIHRFIRILKRLMIENGPYDCIHTHVNITNGYVLYAALLAGIKVRISHSHAMVTFDGITMVKKMYYEILRKLLKYVGTDFLACGEKVGFDLYGRKDSFKIINNGIDVNSFLYKNTDKIKILRNEFDIGEDINVYGNISRFNELKNLQFVVDIFSEIVKRQSNSVLILGGLDGNTKADVLKKIEDYKLEDKIRIVGERDDIPDCLHLMKCYLFPSLSEGLGIAAVEAQAAGVPVLASTEVPQDADMGLNLIEFVPLSEPPSLWAERAIQLFPFSGEKDVIISCFNKRGYNINDSVKNLTVIYSDKR